MGGGAWPVLVGGVICLVNSDNGRDSDMLTSAACYLLVRWVLLRWIGAFLNAHEIEL